MSPALPSQKTAPPTPPPLPPQSSYEAHPPKSHFKIAEKVSGFWEKFQYAQGAFYEASDPGLPIDPLAPKIGPYFFYGTLMDPTMLMEILDLKETPMLRRATIAGYSCKLWGQYPALVNGPQGGIVEGAMYDVQTEEHAAKLAEYETRAYMAAPCDISLVDGEEPTKVCGTTFRYIGPNLDLDEGDFDLKTWLRRMGR
jgi:gamma-glutamylcyclotransferase (GGCT)/AIG2-like uncharacterized protein YtfP